MTSEKTTLLTNCSKQKPEVFIKTIVFNDGTKLDLSPNSIIVFTGANNCGKAKY